MRKVLITGAAGYIAAQILPTFRDQFELTLVDIEDKDRSGTTVPGIQIADLINLERGAYAHLFEGIDAVIHLSLIHI